MNGPTESRQPQDMELFDAVRDFVLEARDAYLNFRGTATYVPKTHDHLKYDEFKTGFPHITQDLSSDLPDYRRPFATEENKWSPIAYGGWTSFERLLAIAENHERLQASFLIDPSKRHEEQAKFFWEFEVSDLPLKLFDRLMHVYGEDFNDDQLREVYCQLEEGVLAEKLPVVFAVPILLTAFEDIDVFPIVSGVAVLEMSKDLHLARSSRHGRPSSSVNEVVAGAATHMLILTGWEMPNFKGYSAAPYDRIDWYPMDRIDRFFDSLRVVTGAETGYAEVFMIPEKQRWAHRFREDLPPVIRGASARRYPSHFDDFGWLVERGPINEEQLIEVAAIYAGLEDHDSLELAARRLSAGLLREEEDDAILDLLIGLEAILSDRDRGELTFKLAVRTAAVLATVPGHDPGIVFGQVKQLYNYRSAVAHGDGKKAAKLRTLEVEGEQVSSTNIAALLLRDVAKQLVSRSGEIAGPSDIDSKLILRSLAQAADMNGSPPGSPTEPAG
jgi:hypothetical protein